jgi:hypothetical protein
MEGPLSPLDEHKRHDDAEPHALDAPRHHLPGWIWIGYMAVGVVVWTGVVFGIRVLITALKHQI